MTKRADVVEGISREAKRQDVAFELDRGGARHTVYRIGTPMIPIPRHREVNEMTTEGIYKECEAELGEGLVAEMSYTVNVTRTEGVWNVHVVEIDRVTQARTLSEVPAMATDLIDIMTGDSDPQLDVKITLPAVAAAHLAEVARLRAVETDARTAAASELREAAVALKRAGLSMRDLGQAIGVSHQRASQLTSGRV